MALPSVEELIARSDSAGAKAPRPLPSVDELIYGKPGAPKWAPGPMPVDALIRRADAATSKGGFAEGYWLGNQRFSDTGLLLSGMPREEDWAKADNLTFWGDIGKGVGSMTDPVGIATMFAGAGLGKWVLKKLGMKAVKSLLVRKGVQAAFEQGSALGLYSSVSEGINEMVIEGQLDPKRVAGAGLHGAILGTAIAPVAMIPGGKTLARKAGAEASKYMAESGIFGLTGAALEGRAPDRDDFSHAFATVAVLKGQKHLATGLKKILGKPLPERNPKETARLERKLDLLGDAELLDMAIKHNNKQVARAMEAELGPAASLAGRGEALKKSGFSLEKMPREGESFADWQARTAPAAPVVPAAVPEVAGAKPAEPKPRAEPKPKPAEPYSGTTLLDARREFRRAAKHRKMSQKEVADFLKGTKVEDIPVIRDATSFLREKTGRKLYHGKWHPETSIGDAISISPDPAPLGRLLGLAGRGRLYPRFLDRAYMQVMDSTHAGRRAVEAVERKIGARIPESAHVWWHMRVVRGHTGQAMRFIKDHLEPIVKDLDSQGAGELNEYMMARRFGARRDQYTDGRLRRHGVVPEDIPKTLSKLAKHKARAEQVDKILYELMADVLGAEQAAEVRKHNLFYIPLFQDVEKLKSGEVHDYHGPREIHELVGDGKAMFSNPYDAIVTNINMMFRAKAHRRVIDSMVELGRLDGGGKYIKEISAQQYRDSSGASAVKRIVMGKEKYYRLDADLYEAFSMLNQRGLGDIMKVVAKPAKALRMGATSTYGFAIRNVLRDVWTAHIQSRYGFTPVDFFIGLSSILKNKDVWKEYQRSGAWGANLVSMDKAPAEHALAWAIADKKGKLIHMGKRPIESIRLLSELSENATRTGAYARARRKGASTMEAAIEARDVSVDFGRMGPWGQQVNALTAFFNAQLQGVDRMRRAHQEAPLKTMAKSISTITSMSIVNLLINRQDPRWADIPDWRKNASWIIFTEDEVYYIPKPFDYGMLYGSMPERFVEWYLDRDPSQAQEVWDAFVSLAPVTASDVVPTAVMSPLEAYVANKSYFTGRPIVGRWQEEELEEPLKYGRHTSKTVRALAGSLGLSPSKVEHIWNGMTGGLGKGALAAADALPFMSDSDAPVEPAPYGPDKPRNFPGTPIPEPFTRIFQVRYPTANGQQVSDLYDTRETEQVRVSSAEERGARPSLYTIRRLKIAKAGTNVLAKLRERAERIADRTDIGGEEKTRKMLEIYYRMTEIATRYNERIEEVGK